MSDILKPETEAQVLEAVQWAVQGEPTTLEILGHGTKRGLGRAIKADAVLDLSNMSGIELFEPQELIMTARAGTALSDVQAALDEARQMLAFEPYATASLYGTEGGTVGGMFAAAQSGPRRPLVGGARDHLLGFKAVSARGETFKSGGRVVKNVTGFDLSKLMTGSMGTLGVMTEVTFKVLPRPEKARTVLVSGASDPGAAMRAAQNSPYEVSAVAYLPEAIAGRSAVSYVNGAGRAITAVRVEGPAPSVAARCDALRDLLGAFGEVEELHTTNTKALWQEIRDVDYFAPDQQIWRLSVPPTDGPAVAARLPGEHYFDWAGGLVWLALSPSDDAHVESVRGAMTSGHATLMRAAEDVRARVDVFQPSPDGVAALSERLRAGFDPYSIFNPGRM